VALPCRIWKPGALFYDRNLVLFAQLRIELTNSFSYSKRIHGVEKVWKKEPEIEANLHLSELLVFTLYSDKKTRTRVR
jgi:hypothetical protein